MDFKTALKGLGAAAAAGAVTGAVGSLGQPITNFKQLGFLALGGAISGAALYLKQSPLPKDDSKKEN